MHWRHRHTHTHTHTHVNEVPGRRAGQWTRLTSAFCETRWPNADIVSAEIVLNEVGIQSKQRRHVCAEMTSSRVMWLMSRTGNCITYDKCTYIYTDKLPRVVYLAFVISLIVIPPPVGETRDIVPSSSVRRSIRNVRICVYATTLGFWTIRTVQALLFVCCIKPIFNLLGFKWTFLGNEITVNVSTYKKHPKSVWMQPHNLRLRF